MAEGEGKIGLEAVPIPSASRFGDYRRLPALLLTAGTVTV
jgi:hypothetical protein